MNRRNVSPKTTTPTSSTKLGFSSQQTTVRGLHGGGTKTSLNMMNPTTTVFFDNTPLWQATSTITYINALGFVISLVTGSHIHLDLLGTGAFAVAAVPPLLAKGTILSRVTMSSAAVCLWGTKLAGFLFFRALKLGHDGRLDETLSTPAGTAGFWIISVLWGVVCSLPHTLGTTSSGEGNGVCLALGTVMYVLGLVTETAADVQKWNFKQSNPGQFCNVGVWSISQHPNFFGNLLLWSGIFVMNAPALIASTPAGVSVVGRILSCKRLFLALLSPLFMWTLFSGQASGSITNAVELANAKYGSDPAYQDYIKSVPLIIPNLFKK